MNYILFNLGKIPDYFKETVNTILSVDKNANVYVGCNENIDLQNCNVLNINEFNSTESNYLDKNNFYRGTNYESNPLWLTSLKRIFYLNLIAENYNLKNFVHFDNDVLIYEPFEKISDCFVDKKINITRHTINQLIFGYSFFPDISLSRKLSSEIYKILVNIDEHIIANNNVPLNEMDMLGIIYKFDKNFLIHYLRYLMIIQILFLILHHMANILEEPIKNREDFIITELRKAIILLVLK